MPRLVKFDFNPMDLVGVRIKDPEKREEALEEIRDFILESVLSDVGEGVSPVTGRKFKPLSKEYAEREHGGDREAKLELEGDLLDSIQVIRKGNTLRLTVDEEEQPKADGHNNFTGKSQLPRRPFIPDAERDEAFRPEIMRGIEKILTEYADDTDEL